VFNFISHLVERYGIDEVSTWYTISLIDSHIKIGQLKSGERALYASFLLSSRSGMNRIFLIFGQARNKNIGLYIIHLLLQLRK